MIPLPKEDDLLMVCVQWFRLTYKEAMIVHIPNEGKRHVSFKVKQKKMGLVSGFPDLLVVYNDKVLFIEVKRDPRMAGHKDKGLSDNQQEVISQLCKLGHDVYIVYSLEDFQKAVGAHVAKWE